MECKFGKVFMALMYCEYLVEWIFQKLKYICSADFLIQAVFYNKNKFWTMKRPLAFMTEAR